MNKDIRNEICEYIHNIMKDACDECRSELAHFIAFQAVAQGSINTYEGVGILECVKREYINICEEVLSEEMEEEEDGK